MAARCACAYESSALNCSHVRRQTSAGHDLQRPLSRLGKHLHFAGPLQVIQVVESAGDARSDDNHAVIGQKQHPLVAELAAHADALRRHRVPSPGNRRRRQCRRRTAARSGCHLEPPLFERGDRGRIGHVGVKHATGVRQAAMNLRVDEHRGRFDFSVAF